VEYYSPHCYHCVKFAEEYESIGSYFKEQGSNVVVAALDLSVEDEGIKKKEDIQGFPSFKIFIGGKGLTFSKDRSAENIINFINAVKTGKFQKTESLDGIPQPYVTVSGVEEDSLMRVVAGLFSKLPIYHISPEGELSVTIHDKDTRQYSGKADVLEVVDWLELETCPIVSSLGESTPNRKLQLALVNHLPLLVVVNKHDDRSGVQPSLDLLTEFCEGKAEFVCGYLHKGEEDYESLIQWLEDSDAETNRLFWINTKKSLKYDYQGELYSLDIN
jgi:hypothetical protein